jgi:hypothetical protein
VNDSIGARTPVGRVIESLLGRYNQHGVRVQVRFIPSKSSFGSQCRHVRVCVEGLFEQMVNSRLVSPRTTVDVESAIYEISKLIHPNSTTIKVGLCLFLIGGGSDKILHHSEDIQWPLVRLYLWKNIRKLSEKIFVRTDPHTTKQIIQLITSISDPLCSGLGIAGLCDVIQNYHCA